MTKIEVLTQEAEMENMTKRNAALEENELDMAALDEVVGGRLNMGSDPWGRPTSDWSNYQPPPNPNGGSAGVYLGFGSNVMGNGPSTVVTLGSDGVHFYDSSSTGLGNGASASGVVGVWAATSSNGSDYWTGPGSAGSVGFKQGGAAAVEFGYNSSGASAGLSLGAGASLGGAAVSASSTFGREIHPFGDTPQAGAPGSLPDQAGFNDFGGHADAGAANGASVHGGDLDVRRSGDHGGDLGADGDHPSDGGNGADHSNNDGSYVDNDFGDSNFGGGDFGGSDFG